MTVFPGWADPFYQRYLGLVAVLLISTGLVLGILRCTKLWSSGGVQKAWVAYRSWFIMAPVMLVTIGLGRVVFIVALGLLSIFFVKEFARATGLYEDWGFVIAVYAGVAGIFWAALTQWYGLFVAMPVYGIVVLMMLPAFRNEYAGMIQKVGLSTIALVYFGWFPAHLAYLSNHPGGYAFVAFLLVGTELNDIAAFITGKLFGKRPLLSRISPNKTIEGSCGSLVVISLFVWAVRPWLPGFTPLLLGLSVLILWIGGTLGDLVVSFVKRDIGIKDMGVLIPGHGGLLDRFDSLIFTSPLFFHMVNHYVRVPTVP